MKNNEKKRFMYGIFALVLAISVGYFGISSMGETYAAGEQCYYCPGQPDSGESYLWTTGPTVTCHGGEWKVISSATNSVDCEQHIYKCYHCTGSASEGNFYKWVISQPSEACNGGKWTIITKVTSISGCNATASCTYTDKDSCESANSGYNCILTNNGCYIKGTAKTKCTYTTKSSCESANDGYNCVQNGTDDYGNTCYETSNKITYTITYDANGGKNAPSSQTKNKGEDLTLSSTEPTRDGYTFLGWSTHKNATSATYGKGSSYKTDSDVTLYAVWKLNAATTYIVTYDANGGKNAPSSQTKNKGENLTLSSTQPTRDGYTFLGWSTDKNATSPTYGSNGTYDIDSDITLYAVWKINTTGDYVVTFDTGYGIITMNVDKDAIIDSIVDPVRDGYTFGGWYADKEYKNKYDFNTKITSDLTLYAKWEKNEKTDDELDENIKTGDVMMFIAWTIGIGALAYGVYYYKTRMED